MNAPPKQPVEAQRLPPQSIERFWSLVEKTPTCWIWRGSVPPKADGYGFFSLGTRSERAHRVAFIVANGVLPAGMMVCHTCDVRLCVRPDHLYLGTASDNNRDRERRGRGVRLMGSAHGMSKLTEDQIFEIRSIYAQGLSLQREIAARYNVAQITVSRIVRGQAWRHCESV